MLEKFIPKFIKTLTNQSYKMQQDTWNTRVEAPYASLGGLPIVNLSTFVLHSSSLKRMVSNNAPKSTCWTWKIPFLSIFSTKMHRSFAMSRARRQKNRSTERQVKRKNSLLFVSIDPRDTSARNYNGHVIILSDGNKHKKMNCWWLN